MANLSEHSLYERVGLIKLESERLGSYLNDLSADSLNMESACEGWTVADVTAHLVWYAEFCLDIIPRGLRGDVAPPKDFPPAGTATEEWMNEYFSKCAIALREELDKDLLPVFRQRYGRVFELLGDLSPQDAEVICYLETGNRPAGAFVDMTINELAIHGWDMRSRLEQSPKLSVELLSLLKERVKWLFRSSRPADFLLGSNLPEDKRYRIDLTGIASDRLDIVVKGDTCRIESPSSGKADASFECDTQIFVLLMNRRLTLAELSQMT